MFCVFFCDAWYFETNVHRTIISRIIQQTCCKAQFLALCCHDALFLKTDLLTKRVLHAVEPLRNARYRKHFRGVELIFSLSSRTPRGIYLAISVHHLVEERGDCATTRKRRNVSAKIALKYFFAMLIEICSLFII